MVLVRDLPEHFTSQELSTAFAQFGKVLFCELGEGNSGRVGYESPRDASNAVATMNGLPVGEKKLLVSLVRRVHGFESMATPARPVRILTLNV